MLFGDVAITFSDVMGVGDLFSIDEFVFNDDFVKDGEIEVCDFEEVVYDDDEIVVGDDIGENDKSIVVAGMLFSMLELSSRLIDVESKFC